jgi:hypothetical protein
MGVKRLFGATTLRITCQTMQCLTDDTILDAHNYFTTSKKNQKNVLPRMVQYLFGLWIEE